MCTLTYALIAKIFQNFAYFILKTLCDMAKYRWGEEKRKVIILKAEQKNPLQSNLFQFVALETFEHILYYIDNI